MILLFIMSVIGYYVLSTQYRFGILLERPPFHERARTAATAIAPNQVGSFTRPKLVSLGFYQPFHHLAHHVGALILGQEQLGS